MSPQAKGKFMTKKFDTYKKQFTKKALENGYSQDNIQKCLNYSQNLQEQNLPIIYNSYHLAGLVGYKHSYLRRSIISTEFFYRHFKVNKKNGEFRKISEPLPSLKEIQNFILKEIFYTQKVSKYCKSYIPKKKFKEYLRFHTNQKEILTLDITDFFPSIQYDLVHQYFLKLGYAEDVSIYLACLCTYSKKENKFKEFKRFLPQGAPTSPYLSNLILQEFDEKIASICKNNEIKYTRYADDMAFSGNKLDKEMIIGYVKDLLPFNLSINDDKSRLMKQGFRQLISGVVVNKKMQLPKEERSEIRKIMYYIGRFGLESHLAKINETRENYISHILGKIQYGLSLNPKDKELIGYKNLITKKYYS